MMRYGRRIQQTVPELSDGFWSMIGYHHWYFWASQKIKRTKKKAEEALRLQTPSNMRVGPCFMKLACVRTILPQTIDDDRDHDDHDHNQR